MKKKAYFISFLVLALMLTAWTASPAQSATARFAPAARSSECKMGADALVGALAEIPRLTNRVRQICDFNIRMNDLGSSLSEHDRRFIEHAIVANMAEIQALTFALPRVTNEELRGLIQMMIAMHTHDLEAALMVAERFNLDTSPDLTNVRVYPGTPDYDLGIRRIDLMAMFLDPLMNAGGMIPTETPTAIPTMDTTGTPTGVPTLEMTGTPGTPTPVPTMDITGTPTTLPTMIPTGSPTFVPTISATAIPTFSVMTPTETPTMVPTTMSGTPTAVLTLPPGGGVAPNFDMVAVHIFEDMHHMHIVTAMAAQRLVKNDEIRAFAKHAADAAELHMLLLSDLKHRLFDGYTPPPPNFQREYQSPRRFEPVMD